MQARTLRFAIHFDARSAATDFERISGTLAANPLVTFAKKRIKCGWDEWSLVEATLLAVAVAVADGGIGLGFLPEAP